MEGVQWRKGCVLKLLPGAASVEAAAAAGCTQEQKRTSLSRSRMHWKRRFIGQAADAWATVVTTSRAEVFMMDIGCLVLREEENRK